MTIEKTAYSYRRVSSAKQLKNQAENKYFIESRDSLDTQYENAEKWCKREGIELDKDLELEDRAVSAADGHNIATGKLRDFLEYCKEGKIARGSFLLFDTWSRGSRGTLDQQLELVKELFSYDIEIVTLNNGSRYNKDIYTKDQLKIYALISEMLAANQLIEYLRVVS